jgi:hypothetical protein
MNILNIFKKNKEEITDKICKHNWQDDVIINDCEYSYCPKCKKLRIISKTEDKPIDEWDFRPHGNEYINLDVFLCIEKGKWNENEKDWEINIVFKNGERSPKPILLNDVLEFCYSKDIINKKENFTIAHTTSEQNNYTTKCYSTENYDEY